MKDWDTTFVVPLGIGAHLEYWGVPPARIDELDWWERVKVQELEIVCTPARHATGRHLFDADTKLWASYAFIGRKNRAYFSGDTGLFPGDAPDRRAPRAVRRDDDRNRPVSQRVAGLAHRAGTSRRRAPHASRQSPAADPLGSFHARVSRLDGARRARLGSGGLRDRDAASCPNPARASNLRRRRLASTGGRICRGSRRRSIRSCRPRWIDSTAARAALSSTRVSRAPAWPCARPLRELFLGARVRQTTRGWPTQRIPAARSRY